MQRVAPPRSRLLQALQRPSGRCRFWLGISAISRSQAKQTLLQFLAPTSNLRTTKGPSNYS